MIDNNLEAQPIGLGLAHSLLALRSAVRVIFNSGRSLVNVAIFRLYKSSAKGRGRVNGCDAPDESAIHRPYCPEGGIQNDTIYFQEDVFDPLYDYN